MLVGAVRVHRQRAAPDVGVAVVDDGLLEVVDLGQRAEEAGLLGGVGQAEVAVAVHEVVVAIALDAEAAERDLQALLALVAEVEADLAEEVLGHRVGHRAAGVQADAATIAVVGHATVDLRDGDHAVPLVALVQVVAGDLPAGAVVLAFGRVAGDQLELVAGLGGRARDVVDDAAGGADALGRRGAIDDLDAADQAHVGEGGVARAFAQRRALRHAVEQAQRDASAQVLTGVAHGLRGLGVARDGARQHGGGVFGHGQGLLHVLAGDHVHRAGNPVHRLGRAVARGDGDAVELLHVLVFVVSGGLLGLGRHRGQASGQGQGSRAEAL